MYKCLPTLQIVWQRFAKEAIVLWGLSSPARSSQTFVALFDSVASPSDRFHILVTYSRSLFLLSLLEDLVGGGGRGPKNASKRGHGLRPGGPQNGTAVHTSLRPDNVRLSPHSLTSRNTKSVSSRELKDRRVSRKVSVGKGVVRLLGASMLHDELHPTLKRLNNVRSLRTHDKE